MTPGGTITTVAGNGSPSFSGDGGLATAAALNYPSGIVVDGVGNLLIADPGLNFKSGDVSDDFAVDQRIREVLADGTIRTLAGTGPRGHSDDDRPAITAS